MSLWVNYDTSHGAWRDVWLALRRADAWPWLLLYAATQKVMHGPFDERRFGTMVSQCLEDYFGVAPPSTCRVLQRYRLL